MESHSSPAPVRCAFRPGRPSRRARRVLTPDVSDRDRSGRVLCNFGPDQNVEVLKCRGPIRMSWTFYTLFPELLWSNSKIQLWRRNDRTDRQQGAPPELERLAPRTHRAADAQVERGASRARRVVFSAVQLENCPRECETVRSRIRPTQQAVSCALDR